MQISFLCDENVETSVMNAVTQQEPAIHIMRVGDEVEFIPWPKVR